MMAQGNRADAARDRSPRVRRRASVLRCAALSAASPASCRSPSPPRRRVARTGARAPPTWTTASSTAKDPRPIGIVVNNAGVTADAAFPGMKKEQWDGVLQTTLGPLLWRAPLGQFLATSALGNHPADPQTFQDVRAYLGVSDVFDLDDRYPFALSPQRRIADLFGVEVGVVPVFVAARVGFNVAEFADFLLGFAFVDLLGDDGVKRPPTLPYLPVAGG